MRAKIMIQNFDWEEGLRNIIEKLHGISGLKDIRVNRKEESISFYYSTEEAALMVWKNLTRSTTLLGQKLV